MFLDNVFRNDKLTTPTDMFDAYDEYKKILNRRENNFFEYYYDYVYTDVKHKFRWNSYILL